MRVNRELIRSLAAFGVVGVAATVTHLTVGLSIDATGIMAPFYTNIIAFWTAFLVSYFGHKHLTFRSDASHRSALPRFMVAALTGFALNQLIVWLAVDRMGLSYAWALAIVVTIVPILVYVISRVWVFPTRAAGTK